MLFKTIMARAADDDAPSSSFRPDKRIIKDTEQAAKSTARMNNFVVLHFFARSNADDRAESLFADG